MSGQGINPKLNVREELGKLVRPSKHRVQQFIFTGNASDVAFTLGRGWKPKFVFGTAGDIKTEGSAEDFTVSLHLGIYTVTFAVAPSAADFLIFAELTV